MAAQFNPVPFGVVRESPLTIIREDAGLSSIWESFRNIDEDKEARVLQVGRDEGSSCLSAHAFFGGAQFVPPSHLRRYDCAEVGGVQCLACKGGLEPEACPGRSSRNCAPPLV